VANLFALAGGQGPVRAAGCLLGKGFKEWLAVDASKDTWAWSTRLIERHSAFMEYSQEQNGIEDHV
jgi:hypothetical protein